MYKRKDRKSGYLFPELFPFGGKLNEKNRWIKIAEMLPWEELEDEYEKHFSDGQGRPALDARLVLGTIMLKHMTGASDEEIIRQIEENPYYQAFCGYEHFQTKQIFDESSLSKLRKRVGAKYFRELEKKTFHVLRERKIIHGRGMLVDASVFPEDITYPTDSGLLNQAREWLVEKIDTLSKTIKKKYRTYKRTARDKYLTFSKKRTKSRKGVEKIQKALLQYVRRNVKQLEEIAEELRRRGTELQNKMLKRMVVIKDLYLQQWEMYRTKTHRIERRIVSIHKPQVRPIKRGKAGTDVEFGPKVAISHVDGFAFLDHISYENFNEAKYLGKQIDLYKERFGKKPPNIVGDNLYGTRDNRKRLAEEEIRDAFVPLGKKAKKEITDRRWRKDMNRKRNRIEGAIGNLKGHVLQHRIRYRIEEGSEIWLRLGFIGMNLKTAVKRI